MEGMQKNSNRKRIIIIVSAVASLALAIAVGVVVYSNTPAQRMKRQIDLGNRYLSELKYEEAIAAFSEALEIDARNETALSGLADAYYGNAGDHAARGDYAGAIDNYQAVVNIAPSRTEAYEGMGTAYFALSEYEKTVEILEGVIAEYGMQILTPEALDDLCNSYEILAEAAKQDGDDERALEMFERLLELRPGEERYENEKEQAIGRLEFAEYRSALQEMAENIVNNETYNFKDALILSDAFLALTEHLTVPVFFSVENGLTIGIYPGGYIYYGEMQDGKREGEGRWYHGDIRSLVLVTCSWKNDIPNGPGRIEGWRNEALIEKQPNYTYGLHTVEICNLTNGRYDGTASIRWDMDSGEVHEWDVPYADGYATVPEGHICRNCGATLNAGTHLHEIEGIGNR
ncbi:MAG: tetratricopeptide repeat protein [Lachnospiraceae bacterium]|nr:tetratricopeptide repeat protein [Lachnospiraceae bacterium]